MAAARQRRDGSRVGRGLRPRHRLLDDEIRQKPPTPDYNLALIDLAEGPRMMARVDGIAPEAVKIGMEVKAKIVRENDQPLVVFEPVDDGASPAASVARESGASHPSSAAAEAGEVPTRRLRDRRDRHLRLRRSAGLQQHGAGPPASVMALARGRAAAEGCRRPVHLHHGRCAVRPDARRDARHPPALPRQQPHRRLVVPGARDARRAGAGGRACARWR